MHRSDQEKYYFVQTLRHYLKTAPSWNHYIRDNIAQKCVVRALGLVLTSSDEHLLAIRFWRLWRS